MTMDEGKADTQDMNDLRKNTQAEISLRCGFAAAIGTFIYPATLLVPLGSITGIIYGIIGLIKACRHPHRYPGRWQAWVGIALCTIMFFVAGDFSARLFNYAQTPKCSSQLRDVALRIGTYAEQHQGNFPATISGLKIPPEKLSYRTYYFYYLHSTHPYLYNGNLAGKKNSEFVYPDRTVLIAPGKKEGASFQSLHDVDLHGRGFAFVDGHDGSLSDRETTKRFPPDGKMTDDTWFIKPLMRKKGMEK